MYICLATVTLYLCGYICVPRQVFSDLFCNKDAQTIAGKCFVLCGTVKDVCSCKIVLGHPSRGDDSDSTRQKKVYSRSATYKDAIPEIVFFLFIITEFSTPSIAARSVS